MPLTCTRPSQRRRPGPLPKKTRRDNSRRVVRRAPGVRGPAALAPGLAGLLGRETVRGPLGVGRLAPLARNGPLFLRVHGGKAACTLGTHGSDLFRTDLDELVRNR